MKPYQLKKMNLFDEKVSERIGKKLIRRKETIAVAESVTSGLLQFAISNIPDAKDFYQGGITAYNLGQKFKHLYVEPIHAMSVNCVSPKVAKEMALEVCQLYRSEWGVGITGYATAVPESENKTFAYYAITYNGKIKASTRIAPTSVDPQDMQLQFVRLVMDRLSWLI